MSYSPSCLQVWVACLPQNSSTHLVFPTSTQAAFGTHLPPFLLQLKTCLRSILHVHPPLPRQYLGSHLTVSLSVQSYMETQAPSLFSQLGACLHSGKRILHVHPLLFGQSFSLHLTVALSVQSSMETQEPSLFTHLLACLHSFKRDLSLQSAPSLQFASWKPFEASLVFSKPRIVGHNRRRAKAYIFMIMMCSDMGSSW